MDQATLASEIRGRLGDPPESQLPEPQVERAIAAALREFSRFKPLHREVLLNLVTGQAEYELPPEAIAVEVSEQERYLAISEYEMGPEFPDMPPILTDPWERFYYQRRLEREDIGWQPEVVPSEDGIAPARLRLYPIPRRDGKMAVRITTTRALDQVEPRDLEPLILFALAECLEYMGRRRNKSVTQIPTATGAVRLDDGLEMRREAYAMKREVRRLLGQGASTVAAG